jgi:magnesium transporter
MKPKIQSHIDVIHGQIEGGEVFNPLKVANKLTKLHKYDVGLFFASLSKLEGNLLGEVLLRLPTDSLALALGRVTPHKIAAAVQALESNDATDLMQRIATADEALGQKILMLVHPNDRSHIEELSKYTADQAGAYMEHEYLAAYDDDVVASVKELIRQFRANEPGTPIIKLFVIDHEGILIGTIHFSDMILFDDTVMMSGILEKLAHKPPISIRPNVPIREVVRLFEEYDLNVVAVVDKTGKLIGRIAYDDIYDIIRKTEAERALALAGVKQEAEEGTLFDAAKQRLTWLIVNLGAILCASFVVDQFSETIAAYIALAALLPVIAALGGNAGIQALTVTIRKLALDEVEFDDVSGILKREFLIVAFNGLAVAAVASLVVFVWFGDWRLSAIVSAALVFNLLVAGTAGTLIPIGLTKMGVDPAIASSVFLTTTTDIFGFFIFLFLAQSFLI